MPRRSPITHFLGGLVVVIVLLAGASCGGMATPHGEPVSGAAPAPVDGSGAGNPFVPDDRDLSDCQSSLPRPDCGSDDQGGTAQLLTFGILMAGMAFIGWRIVVGVRGRESG